MLTQLAAESTLSLTMLPKQILVQPLGLCPCGKEIAASMDPPSVVHGLPYCEKFLALEPDEFLTYVRRSRGISDEEAGM